MGAPEARSESCRQGRGAPPRAVRGFALRLACCTALLAAWLGHAGHAQELDVQTRVELQRTLAQYVSAKTEDGIYPFFDVEAGEPRRLTLKKLHPVIFQKEGYYLMCADFMDEEGSDVLVDYIVRKRGAQYLVEQEVAGRRGFFKSIFEKVF